MLRIVRRGILGGTFDPPHLAHLLAGEAAYRELALDVVTFIPAGAPWQKAGSAVSPLGDRWSMTQLAVEGIHYFEADDREITRPGWTYTAETLATFPEDEDLVLVLGSDAASRIGSWERSGEVLARATIAVAPRPGTGPAPIGSGPHHLLSMPGMPISGTMIRERRRGGRSIRFLVPEPVWHYIDSHGLYEP
jgi:nicotinate-nucleotide adenylyltransferase